MADSKELRVIVGAMTDRPWMNGPQTRGVVPIDSSCGKPVIDGCGCCGSPGGREEDRAGIIALANHADALVELLAACEELQLAAWGAERARARARFEAALAAVRAVGREPSDG